MPNGKKSLDELKNATGKSIWISIQKW